MRGDSLNGGYCKTRMNLGGSAAGQIRMRVRVTVSGGGAIQVILGATELVDNMPPASPLGDCQFKYGGIAKAPGEHPGGNYR